MVGGSRGVGVQIENTWARCSQEYERPGSSVPRWSSRGKVAGPGSPSILFPSARPESFVMLRSSAKTLQTLVYFADCRL